MFYIFGYNLHQKKVTNEDLKFYNNNLQYDWEPGEFVIQIGTNSSNVKKASVIWIK